MRHDIFCFNFLQDAIFYVLGTTFLSQKHLTSINKRVINTIPLKGGIILKAKEILEIISMPWCSNQDIMKIGNVSTSTASKIKKAIESEFRKKEPNKFMPAHCVPTKEVIK